MLLSLLFSSCERDISDDAVQATYPNTAEIYTDSPIGLTNTFFHSISPKDGANTKAFNVDDKVAYESQKSIRIDVPALGDPNGSYVGGVFIDRGNGRNLTQYDALTFYVKASRSVSKGLQFGFGTDYLASGLEINKYSVSTSEISLSTNWEKVIIPIPDPSFLSQVKGVFSFIAESEKGTGGVGYTMWIDEIKFEKLGTVRLLNPIILNGENKTLTKYLGEFQEISQLGATFNLPSGRNLNLSVSPFYFNFYSSNPSVNSPIIINSFGQVTTQVTGSTGTSNITAKLANILAKGSLKINAGGAFPLPPTPTREASKVTSLFSDTYTNVPVRHYNGFFAPYQTTLGGAGSNPNNVDIKAPMPNGLINNLINYTKLNFVSIGTYETVPLLNIAGRTHLHLDINVREALQNSDYIKIQLESGTGTGSTSSGTYTITSSALGNKDANGWVSIDIPLASFPGFNNLNALGQLFFISDTTISDIWVDNVYFYTN